MSSVTYPPTTEQRRAYEHIALETRALRIEEQLEILNHNNWSEKDKETMREFYHGQLASIQDKVELVINEMPVFNPEIVS